MFVNWQTKCKYADRTVAQKGLFMTAHLSIYAFHLGSYMETQWLIKKILVFILLYGLTAIHMRKIKPQLMWT